MPSRPFRRDVSDSGLYLSSLTGSRSRDSAYKRNHILYMILRAIFLAFVSSSSAYRLFPS